MGAKRGFMRTGIGGAGDVIAILEAENRHKVDKPEPIFFLLVTGMFIYPNLDAFVFVFFSRCYLLLNC